MFGGHTAAPRTCSSLCSCYVATWSLGRSRVGILVLCVCWVRRDNTPRAHAIIRPECSVLGEPPESSSCCSAVGGLLGWNALASMHSRHSKRVIAGYFAGFKAQRVVNLDCGADRTAANDTEVWVYAEYSRVRHRQADIPAHMMSIQHTPANKQEQTHHSKGSPAAHSADGLHRGLEDATCTREARQQEKARCAAIRGFLSRQLQPRQRTHARTTHARTHARTHAPRHARTHAPRQRTTCNRHCCCCLAPRR